MSFHVGQKVICVDDTPASDGTPVCLILNRTYTVSGLGGVVDERGYGIRVAEAIAPSSARLSGYYSSHRFRAVIERKTDISIFTEMLKPRELVRVSND